MPLHGPSVAGGRRHVRLQVHMGCVRASVMISCVFGKSRTAPRMDVALGSVQILYYRPVYTERRRSSSWPFNSRLALVLLSPCQTSCPPIPIHTHCHRNFELSLTLPWSSTPGRRGGTSMRIRSQPGSGPAHPPAKCTRFFGNKPKSLTSFEMEVARSRS